MSQRSTPRPWPTRLLLLALLLGAPGVAWVATQRPPVAHAAPAISPYVWGTNLTLSDQNDLFLTNAATLKLTQQLHVQMIRFPDRGNLAVTTAAAKQILALHAVPLLILHYSVAQLSADQALIQMMNSVFGNQTVYYEYGNEMDLPANGGISAATYTASWNTVMPQLQPLAHAGRFIGPANFQANPSYVGYFVQHASPQPFGVSWHEYTCNTQASDQYCLSHIDNWTTHIQAALQAMGKSLPILITEYNWNPTPAGDPRASNATFLQQWTQRAIAMLIQNQVFAANQYVLTNNAQLAMISDSTHTLTGAGLAFQATFEQSMGATPPTGTVTATDTPVATPSVTTIASTPTVLPQTPTASPSSLVCFQQQTASNTPVSGTPTLLCVPVVSPSGSSVGGQPMGMICFPLYPVNSQTPSASTPTPSGVSTVCVPVYEGTPSAPTSTPTPVATTSTATTTPTATPTVSPSPESTPVNTPTVTATAITPRVTPTITPTAKATPFIGS